MLAEDNPVTRKLIEKTLQKAGHEVTSVENGRKALDLFNEKISPEAVINQADKYLSRPNEKERTE